MKVTITHPDKKYPYLAVHTMGLSIEEMFKDAEVDSDDIFIINKVGEKLWAQTLTGKYCGYSLEPEKENNYRPLPENTKVEIVQ